RFSVTPQVTTRIDEFLASVFGVGAGRGALRVTTYAFPGGSPTALQARVIVRSANDADGSDGATVSGIAQALWTSASKQILSIPNGPADQATLAVTNLDALRGTVRFDLSDAVGGYIGSGVFELGASTARWRSLADLFRNLSQRPAPFRATFFPSTIRFTAAALVTDPSTTDISVLTSAP
ncbi:MAG: hypothetical protein ABIV06_02865, partial [Thermoanaerobaculia bacterium]